MISRESKVDSTLTESNGSETEVLTVLISRQGTRPVLLEHSTRIVENKSCMAWW